MFLLSLGTAKLGTAKTEKVGGDLVVGRVFGNHRSRLVLIAAVVVVLVALAAVAVVDQRGDRASADEPQTQEPPASLGIDPRKGTCPKVAPEELPPDALAGATEAALAYFENVEEAEGQYAVSAERGLRGGFYRYNCPELSPQRAKLLQKRTVVVSLEWPKMFPSASLSQRTVFVAKFESEYRVWWMWH
jgi:hypothetical protein